MKKVISVILAISFIALLITVISMSTGGEHHGPPGGQMPPQFSDNATDAPTGDAVAKAMPPPEGRGDFYPRKLHEIAGYSILFLGILHILYNGKCLLSYVGIKRRCA